MKRLRVISFNMQFGQTWDPLDPDRAPVDLDQTVRELRHLDADVILLQEVEQVDPELGQVHPPPNFSRLREALEGYDSHFSYPAKDPRELPFGFGLAIFSRTPLENRQVVDLPAPRLTFQFRGRKTAPTKRVLIGATTCWDGHVVQLFNTHLQAFFIIERTSDKFPQQRNRVAKLLRQSTLPTLLGGDFNAAPGEGTVDQLEAVGYKTVQRKQVTWKRMPYVLDHLFYSRHFRLLQGQILPTRASDHDLLVGEFALRPSRSPAARAIHGTDKTDRTNGTDRTKGTEATSRRRKTPESRPRARSGS